jgi:hypothetical protein
VKFVLSSVVAALVAGSIVAVSARGADVSRQYPRGGNSRVALTSQGRLLRSFEALLRETFGHRAVSRTACGKHCSALDFSCAGECSPLATYLPYWYVFAQPGETTLHLSSRNPASLFFGNYPVPILVRRRAVACDAQGRRFLAAYADAASFTLACLAPR